MGGVRREGGLRGVSQRGGQGKCDSQRDARFICALLVPRLEPAWGLRARPQAGGLRQRQDRRQADHDAPPGHLEAAQRHTFYLEPVRQAREVRDEDADAEHHLHSSSSRSSSRRRR